MANVEAGLRIGYKAFISRCVGQEGEATYWVKTGEWLNDVPVPAISDQEISVKFRARARQVNRRPRTAILGWSPEGRRCQFSGLMANVFNGSEEMPFWAASVDYRVPVNGSRAKALYAVKNLQIMISVFNSVEANHTDANLEEWYDRIFASS